LALLAWSLASRLCGSVMVVFTCLVFKPPRQTGVKGLKIRPPPAYFLPFIAVLRVVVYTIVSDTGLLIILPLKPYMPKLQEVNESQYMITIPIQLKRAMGWERGDTLQFRVKDNNTLELTISS